MANRNALIIIPLAVGVWLGAIVLTATGAPLWVVGACVAAFAVTVPLVVLYLMSHDWRALARRYRMPRGQAAEWQVVPAANVSSVPVDDAAYARNVTRFVGAMRVAASGDGLSLATLFSPLPVAGWFFPPLHVPWSDVASARTYEAPGWAPGWTTPKTQPGAILNLRYDPNYTGEFVELCVGEPPVYIQLPTDLVAAFNDRLDISPRPG